VALEALECLVALVVPVILLSLELHSVLVVLVCPVDLVVLVVPVVPVILLSLELHSVLVVLVCPVDLVVLVFPVDLVVLEYQMVQLLRPHPLMKLANCCKFQYQS
jgi:hypothetical protein